MSLVYCMEPWQVYLIDIIVPSEEPRPVEPLSMFYLSRNQGKYCQSHCTAQGAIQVQLCCPKSQSMYRYCQCLSAKDSKVSQSRYTAQRTNQVQLLPSLCFPKSQSMYRYCQCFFWPRHQQGFTVLPKEPMEVSYWHHWVAQRDKASKAISTSLLSKDHRQEKPLPMSCC